jgi:hypothetical protein
VNNNVIEVGKGLSVGDAIQDHVYQTCIRTMPASQAKGHSYKLVAPPRSSKGRLGLVLVLEFDDVEGSYRIDTGEYGGPGQPGQVVLNVTDGAAGN